LLFFPDDYFISKPDAAGLTYEEFEVEVEPGATATGWIVERDPSAPWILHFHGNAGNISHRVDHLQLFHNLGFNGVVFDYRGYGKSKGIPNEAGLVADGAAVVEFLTEEKGVDPDKLVYFGESLGGGVAAALAEKEPPRALILKSTFTSVPDLAAEVYPFLPARWISKTKFNTKDRIQNFIFPVLVIHGRPDTVVPFEHGQRLFQLANQPKEFLDTNRDHNTSPMSIGGDFRETIKNFVQKAMPQEY
jgi:fermentation-respiration switch protein FrsA (DUF1100 family)